MCAHKTKKKISNKRFTGSRLLKEKTKKISESDRGFRSPEKPMGRGHRSIIPLNSHSYVYIVFV